MSTQQVRAIPTRDLIVARLKAAPKHTMSRSEMNAMLRYRPDSDVVLRQLVKEGCVVRTLRSDPGKRGPRPLVYQWVRT